MGAEIALWDRIFESVLQHQPFVEKYPREQHRLVFYIISDVLLYRLQSSDIFMNCVVWKNSIEILTTLMLL
jgi:hypothetical protein